MNLSEKNNCPTPGTAALREGAQIKTLKTQRQLCFQTPVPLRDKRPGGGCHIIWSSDEGDWPEPVPMEPAKPKEEPLICVCFPVHSLLTVGSKILDFVVQL